MRKTKFIFIPALFSGFLFLQFCGIVKPVSQEQPIVPRIINEYQMQLDGPYVQYKNDLIWARYIYQDSGEKKVLVDTASEHRKLNLPLRVKTESPDRFFTVRLKKNIGLEPSEFPEASKMLVISDIEGNFKAFRNLLISNGVIDTLFTWTFGSGHVVLVGDFFDRGDQVTEVLWLIYSLEEKAVASGGYVHFILGNHEIMNMGGDLRYVQQKYKDNAQLMHENYESLYGEKSELGRWLRSKNIMEKVGPFLFTHGGVSQEVNQLKWDLDKINKTARPKYADGEYEFPSDKLTILYHDETSPFWYRGYYVRRPPGIEEQINNTLKVFNVKHIVTGHTIVADTVSSWYDGKVFNTDTHHSEGKSGAMLVEGKMIYRVDAQGNRFLLHKE